jgi:hypothetical protein
MGGSSGGGGDTTTTQEPWAGQAPYLMDLMSQAQNMFHTGQGQQYYPGQTVAGFSPQTQYGLDSLYGRGMSGSPLQDPMNQFLGASMANPAGMAGVGTDMPGQNPYLDQMFNTVAQRSGEQFQEQTMPAIGAMFGGAGRTGSGAHQQVAQGAADDFSQNLLQQAGDIYGRDYEQAMGRDIERRGLMGDIGFRGATAAPSAQAMDYQNIDQMLRAGAITEDQAQRMIDAERQRFDFYQQAPWQGLGQYGNMVQGMPNLAESTTSGQGGGSRLMGGLGGAMAGAGLGGSVAALNPYTLPLAIGGGLLGMY